MLIKNDDSPVSFPLLHPYGHVAFQAQRADVHTVLVDGRVVKRAGKLVGIDLRRVRDAVDGTVEYAMRTLGDESWAAGMHPEIPERRSSRTRTSTPSGTRGRHNGSAIRT